VESSSDRCLVISAPMYLFQSNRCLVISAPMYVAVEQMFSYLGTNVHYSRQMFSYLSTNVRYSQTRSHQKRMRMRGNHSTTRSSRTRCPGQLLVRLTIQGVFSPLQATCLYINAAFNYKAGLKILFVGPPATHANKGRKNILFCKIILSVYFSENCSFILYTWAYIFQIHKH